MKRLLPILVVMAMMMVAGAVGFAIADSHGDLFYACERNGKVVGKVMVNDQPTCRRGATLVSWNSEGPAGPPGGAVQTVIRQSDDSHHYFIDDVTVEVYATAGPTRS